MHRDTETIFDAAVKLPESERLLLISRLMDSMPQADLTVSLDDANLRDEIERRFNDSDDTVSWSDLRAEG
jgi:putative addiction module component (TIGR02574 family)